MERFWSKVGKTGTVEYPNCWIWMAYRNKKGYGRFRVQNKMWLAHRVSWSLSNGEIPKGKQILHKCDNPPCVNPDHLKLGTSVDNMRDRDQRRRHGRYNAKKTHCPQGHSYSGNNLYVYPNGKRKCRKCIRDHNYVYKVRRRIERNVRI